MNDSVNLNGNPTASDRSEVNSQKQSHSPEAELEILKLIIESMRLEAKSKESRIITLQKENDQLRDEISLQKRKMKKFGKSFFQILQKTGLDKGLLKTFKAETEQIFAKKGDFEADESNFSSLEGIPAVSTQTPMAPAQTDIAFLQTQMASAQTDIALAQTQMTSTQTNQTSAQTDKASAQTPKAFPQTDKASAQTERASAQTDKASAQTPEALAQTPETSAQTQKALAQTPEAFRQTLNDSAKTHTDSMQTDPALLNTKTGQSITAEALSDEENFQKILEGVLHKNLKHKSYIENGISKPIGNKQEVHSAELIEKAIHGFYKLPGFSEQLNTTIAYRMIFALREEFELKFPVITSHITMAQILIYLYAKGKITPQDLLKDLGYSRATCYKVYKIFRQKLWLEAYGLKESDGFYFTDKGRRFVEKVISGVQENHL